MVLLTVVNGLAQENHISLAGQWYFNLGGTELPEQVAFTETVVLPGTTDENKKGTRNMTLTTSYLNRIWEYEGPAWYQKEITIPQAWQNKTVFLFLERTKLTRVWLDNHEVGSHDQLSTPHIYNLTEWASPGKHRLTILVDNTRSLFPMRITHALSERTQTNWNGIIGRFELIAKDKMHLENIKAYPDLKHTKIAFQVSIANWTERTNAGELTITIEEENELFVPRKIPFKAGPGTTVIQVDYPIGKKMRLWSEFSPYRYLMKVAMASEASGQSYKDSQLLNIGMREFNTRNTQFTINGLTTFLRGKHDGCVFPITGYPPMNVEEWERVFKISKSFGINFYRFHSWCPPEAAFEAADRLGMYLQPELPMWGKLEGRELTNYLMREGDLILQTYGNHPSFVMLSLGNELDGDFDAISGLFRHFKKSDPRHLYALGSNNSWQHPEKSREGDYWTTSSTYREGGKVVMNIDLVRGSMVHDYLGHINNMYPPSTVKDYTTEIARSPIPVIAHELGQYLMYPNFDEINKYTGVLTSYALPVFRERLKKNHMLNFSDRFFHASGALAAICYREDIEAVLRTEGMGGFVWYDLQDYPGQGTAYMGLVDGFMDPKSIVAPERWRQFCSETVLLLLIPKRTWTDNETLKATVKVASYGPQLLGKKEIVCSLLDARGNRILKKILKHDIPTGGLFEIGEIEFPLSNISTPQKLTLKANITGTDIQNEYDLWLYPNEIKYAVPEGLIVSRELNDDTLERLKSGSKVLLLPELFDLRKSEKGQFITNFWTVPYFKHMNPPGTLGILCDPDHPIFRHFPTEYHSNWQWWPMTKYARPVILDEMPPELIPLVQVIDNYETCRRLGLIFEVQVEKGRLLFCASDFLNHRDKPEVRQLLYSILRYMDSDAFHPDVQVKGDVLMDLFECGCAVRETAEMTFPERSSIQID